MINAEELRLNNLVKCSVSNDYGTYQVTAIGGWERTYDKKDKYKNTFKDERIIFIDRCTTNSKGEPFCESKIKPIKLTEEWLLKFGFKWEDKYKIHCGRDLPDGNTLIFYFSNGEITNTQIYNAFDQPQVIIFRPIKYVHQLQNLYYALTSKELTINS
jgi:hypothetical protein